MQLKFVDYRFHLTWIHLNVNFVIWLYLQSSFIRNPVTSVVLVIFVVKLYWQTGYTRRQPGYTRNGVILVVRLYQ